MVTRAGQRPEHRVLGGETGGEREAALPLLQSRDALLEGGAGRLDGLPIGEVDPMASEVIGEVVGAEDRCLQRPLRHERQELVDVAAGTGLAKARTLALGAVSLVLLIAAGLFAILREGILKPPLAW